MAANHSIEAIVAAISPFLGNGNHDNTLKSLANFWAKDNNIEIPESSPIKSLMGSSEETLCITEVTSVKEIQDVIKAANLSGKKVRTLGSEHSVKKAIIDETVPTEILLLTGNLRKVELIEEKDGFLTVRAGAGCHLGCNPEDHATKDEDKSKLENSFNYQVDQAGYALPILGGISQQTLAGFLSTGSAGGSVKHGFADVIEKIEFVNGNGEKMEAQKDTDLWRAMGVSLGLLGVITHITFKLGKRFYVEGEEKNTSFDESSIGRNKEQGPGVFKLKDSINNHEYYKVYWFAQKFVNRVQDWNAVQVPAAGGIDKYVNSLSKMPLLANIGMRIIDHLLQLDCPNYYAIAFILWIFVPACGENRHQHFKDLWYEALPSDEHIPVDGLMKMIFMEIWFPLDKSDEVMAKLEELFKKDPKAAGNTAIEIYGAKKSPFWLSPSNDGATSRFDALWFAHNSGGDEAREDFYGKFYEVLLGIGKARFHWGKHMPELNSVHGNTTFDHDYINEAYPKLKDWKKVREEMDPNDVFLTTYWKNYLNL